MHRNRRAFIVYAAFSLALVLPDFSGYSRACAADKADVALIQQMAKDDNIYRKCLTQLTPEELIKHLEVKRIQVRKSSEALIIVTPLDASPASNCFLWGAHEPMVAIYRQIDSRYYQLMEPGALGSVEIMNTYSNGYPDLKTTYPLHAGASLSIDLYKFDGHIYVHKKNTIKKNR
jgi:hypothetical protein